MVKITGVPEFRQALEGAKGPAMVQAVTQALFVFGNRIQVAAQTSITDGAVSGKNHVPSLPGQPPNQDTGVLANNIETLVVGPLHVEVQSKAPYAVFQEFGTSKMAERPYMRPALAQEKEAGMALVTQAVNHVLKGGTVR